MRALRLLAAVARSNLGELPLPYRMTLALTARCQLRCRMCGLWRREGGAELTLDELDALFRRARWLSWLNLTGGEIALREDAPEILAAAARHLRSLALLNFPTNGWETEVVVRLVRHALERLRLPRTAVTVSLDGPRELHDALRGRSGSYDRALATYRALASLRSGRFQVYLGFTAQAANVARYRELLAELGRDLPGVTARDVHVNLAHRSPHAYGNAGFDGRAAPAEARAFLGEVLAHRGRPGLLRPLERVEASYLRRARAFVRTGRTPLPCQAASASCFVAEDGTVYPCTGLDAPIGSLRDHRLDLGALWRSAARARARAAVRAGDCPQCWTPCEAYPAILARALGSPAP